MELSPSLPGSPVRIDSAAELLGILTEAENLDMRLAIGVGKIS